MPHPRSIKTFEDHFWPGWSYLQRFFRSHRLRDGPKMSSFSSIRSSTSFWTLAWCRFPCMHSRFKRKWCGPKRIAGPSSCTCLWWQDRAWCRPFARAKCIPKLGILTHHLLKFRRQYCLTQLPTPSRGYFYSAIPCTSSICGHRFRPPGRTVRTSSQDVAGRC